MNALVRLLCLLCCALLAGPLAADPIDLYKPGPGLVTEHTIDKQGYGVRFVLTGRLVGEPPVWVPPENKRKPGYWKFTPPEASYEIPAPEQGRFKKDGVVGSLMLTASAKEQDGKLVVTIKHRALWIPPSGKIPLKSRDQNKLLLDIAALLPGNGSRLKSALRKIDRQNDDQTRTWMLRTIARCYHQREADLKLLVDDDEGKLRWLAKLLSIDSKGASNSEQLAERLKHGVGGFKAAGWFRPAVEMGRPLETALLGKVGRVTFAGAVEPGKDDWYRVETGQRSLAPVEAIEAEEGVRWFVVKQAGFKGFLLRIHGTSEGAMRYKIEAKSKLGDEHTWAEHHEPPAPDTADPN